MEKTFKGVGVVYVHGGKNIKFVDGEYTTSDPKEIKRLEGYPVIVEKIEPPEESKTLTIKKLKGIADEKGIDIAGLKKSEILEKLKEAESK